METAPHQTSSPATAGFFVRTAEQVRQFFCGLHGHDALLHFEHGRLSLLCTSCGYESPGWEVKAAQARRERGETGRIVSMPLVHERRVA
jgi:hypothetical protein